MISLDYLFTLVATMVIELLVVFIFHWIIRWPSRNVKSGRLIGGVVIVNLITNPILNYLVWLNGYFAFCLFARGQGLVSLLELVVVFVEASLFAYFWRERWWKMLILSVFVNLASSFFGYLLFRVLFY
jgi:hypothetical protein